MAEKNVVIVDGIPFQQFGNKLIPNKELHSCGKLAISDYNTAGIDFGSDVIKYHCEGCGDPVIRSFDPIGGWSAWLTYRW